MSRLFTEDGKSVPVTLIEATPNRITQVKTVETDGYSAVQVAVGVKRAALVNKPAAGHLAKAKVEAGRGLWELRVEADKIGDFAVGGEIKADIFEVGQIVDVQGVTKGKGFQGTIKRWNFKMGDATHGNSLSHRSPGSIGQRQTPGRVFPGKKMSGHMGSVQQTTQRLQVVKVDAERGLIADPRRGAGRAGRRRDRASDEQGSLTMELAINNSENTLSVSDAVFGREFSEDLVHQVVVAYRNAGRAGTKAQKTRSEVNGTTKKSKKQKGGGARHGALTAPIFVGGGVTFAAKPRSFAQKVNRKMYRAAISAILSELNRQGRIMVVEGFDVDAPKTKGLIAKLKDLEVGQRPLIVTEEASENLYLSARNLRYVEVRDVQGLDPVALVGADTVVITSDAVKKIEEWLA